MNKANNALVYRETRSEALREEGKRQRKKWEVNEAEDFGSIIKPNAPFPIRNIEEGKSSYKSPTAAHVNRVLENEKIKKPITIYSPTNKPIVTERATYSDSSKLPPPNTFISNSPSTAPARTIGIKSKWKSPAQTLEKTPEIESELQRNSSTEMVQIIQVRATKPAPGGKTVSTGVTDSQTKSNVKMSSLVLTGNFLSPQKRKLAFELLHRLLEDLTRYFDSSFDHKSTERKDKKEWSTGLKRTLQTLPPQIHKHAIKLWHKFEEIMEKLEEENNGRSFNQKNIESVTNSLLQSMGDDFEQIIRQFSENILIELFKKDQTPDPIDTKSEIESKINTLISAVRKRIQVLMCKNDFKEVLPPNKKQNRNRAFGVILQQCKLLGLEREIELRPFIEKAQYCIEEIAKMELAIATKDIEILRKCTSKMVEMRLTSEAELASEKLRQLEDEYDVRGALESAMKNRDLMSLNDAIEKALQRGISQEDLSPFIQQLTRLKKEEQTKLDVEEAIKLKDISKIKVALERAHSLGLGRDSIVLEADKLLAKIESENDSKKKQDRILIESFKEEGKIEISSPSSENSIRLKCHYDGDIRVLTIPKSTSFLELRKKLEIKYAKKGFVVKYKDDVGDLITVLNQEDLDEFMKMAQANTFDIYLTESISPVSSQRAKKQNRRSVENLSLQSKEFDSLRKSTGNIKINQQTAAKTRNGGKIIKSKDWQNLLSHAESDEKIVV